MQYCTFMCYTFINVSFSSSQCCNWFYNLQVYPQLLLWPPFQLTRKLLQDWQDTVPLMVTGWMENWSHLMLPQKVSMSSTLPLPPSLPLSLSLFLSLSFSFVISFYFILCSASHFRVVILPKNEIDKANKDKKHKQYPSNFKVRY